MGNDKVIEIMKNAKECILLPHDVLENIINKNYANILSKCVKESNSETTDATAVSTIVSAIYKAIAKGEYKASIGLVNNSEFFKDSDIDFFTYWDDIVSILKNKGYKVEVSRTDNLMLTIYISWD